LSAELFKLDLDELKQFICFKRRMTVKKIGYLCR